MCVCGEILNNPHLAACWLFVSDYVYTLYPIQRTIVRQAAVLLYKQQEALSFEFFQLLIGLFGLSLQLIALFLLELKWFLRNDQVL